MSVTLKRLDITDEAGRPLYKLVGDYHYRLGPGSTITVPDGYVTNMGTIPRLLYSVVSPGELGEAAIVHDYLSNEDLTDDDRPVFSGYSRWIADAVLYEVMARMGFRWPRRILVYAGVRLYSLLTKTQMPPKPEELTQI